MTPDVITLLSSLATGAVGIVVCLINNHFQQAKITAIIEYRLTALENKVDKHNNLIERTYHLEEQAAVHEEKIKVANHRIEDLEKERTVRI